MEAQQQNTLAELIQSALSGTDVTRLMRQAAALIACKITATTSAVWELASDGGTLVLRAGFGWPDVAIGQVTMDVGTISPLNGFIRTPPPMVESWADAMLPRLPTLPRGRSASSSVYALIPGIGHPFGVLSVEGVSAQMFTDAEIEALMITAYGLGLAIEYVRTTQTLDQRIEERTHEIEAQRLAAAQKTAVLEERQRLARDLHDSVTQGLYGITLHAQVAQRLLEAGDATSAAESLHALQDTAQEALDEMRLLIFELRPPILEQVGLVAALRARLNAVEGRAHLQTKLIADDIQALPAPIEQALYRIAQEALNNILKHAHAQRIIVRVLQSHERVLLEIIDDGVGFDAVAAGDNGGLGLRGIVERVAQLGGTFNLASTAETGTQLRMEIPL